jgi:hypothetical protein
MMMAKRQSRIPALALLLVVLPVVPLGGAGAGAGASSSTPESANVTCSFSNPSYSGWCRATAAVPKGKTGQSVCEGVLACLNDTHCAKPYCEATTTRSGWKLEKVEPAAKP